MRFHAKKCSLQEQKEDLRKRLSYTTHKLELLESEFDSTRQYLETELRRAQEELEKFTDKLRRYAESSSTPPPSTQGLGKGVLLPEFGGLYREKFSHATKPTGHNSYHPGCIAETATRDYGRGKFSLSKEIICHITLYRKWKYYLI
ncbi:hypothetical protein AAFF_G00203390 [Aldrovandia affinis]|uniref:Uncharacterized protein n=1 Tax=Aldrovandia affinis TaxID=143900 RepID=A0AAD7SXX5_9TELE|nr:hypothetical protein AAFF_G00203390 [Aldrovandia affinis]